MSVLNPALFKLKISQAKCPVSTGQILPLLSDKLKLNQQDSLNYGFYKVESVSRQQRAGKDKKETYHLALTPVEWDAVNFSWLPAKEGSVSPHPFDISVSSEDLHNHFGIYTASTTKWAAERAISKYIEALFKRAGKLQDFQEKYSNIDFDKIFRIIALKAMTKSGINLRKEDKEDIFHNALVQLLEKEAISLYDENRGSFINFLWGYFDYRIKDELRNFAKTNKYERLVDEIHILDDDSSKIEESMDSMRDIDSELSMEEKVDSSSIVEDFKEYLSLERSGEVLVSIVDMLMQKFKKKEIAERLGGIDKSRISQHLKRIIKSLKEYAEESENDTLLASIEEAILKRKSAEEEPNILLEIFELYDQKLENAGSEYTAGEDNVKLAERVPVGETIKIKRKPMPNFEDLTKQVVQDPEKSGSKATEDVEAYLQELTSADELIEHEGKLIALRIQRK